MRRVCFRLRPGAALVKVVRGRVDRAVGRTLREPRGRVLVLIPDATGKVPTAGSSPGEELHG